MPKFLDATISISFGNLSSGETDDIPVSNICRYTPLTTEQYDTINTLGLDDIQSGSWSNIN